jgi:hypothetical protein
VGKKKDFFAGSVTSLRLRQLDLQAAFGGRLICIFFFDLWMNYGWTTTLLLITLYLHATGLAKGGGWVEFWDGGKGMIGREALGRFEATTRRLDIHTNIK